MPSINIKKISRYSLLAFLLFFVLFIYFSVAPSHFPQNSVFTVEKGSTSAEVAINLKKAGLIRSTFMYKAFSFVLGGRNTVMAGNYSFSQPESALKIAHRIIVGDLETPQVKITFREGISNAEVAEILVQNLPDFDSKNFLLLAKNEEGYLFPDTYFFTKNVTPEQVIEIMKNNFQNKMKNIDTVSKRNFSDVIKMASIIEREAAKTEDRRVIAGILWKRLDNSYPLQVDAPFYYTLKKESKQLTQSDLEKDSPYNLYVHKGLPPTPIGNPGLQAIQDTLNPIATEYWFYLSDSKGGFHYAVTHDGHLANREKYLQ